MRFEAHRVTALSLMLALATPALAAEPPTARQLYDQGYALAVKGKHGKALVLFERAYGLSPEPDYLPAIGRAHDKLGRFDVACSYYQRYLKAKPKGELVDGVKKYLAELQPKYDCAAASKPLEQGTLVLIAGPAGTKVSVDGKLIGATPLTPVAVPVGERIVLLAPPDRPAKETRVVIRVGETTTLDITSVFPAVTRGRLRVSGTVNSDRVLIDGRPVASVAEPLEVNAGTHVVEVTRADVDPFRAEVAVIAGSETTIAVTFATSTAPKGIGPWPWVLGGVGVAALVTGVVFTVVANRQYAEYEDGGGKDDSKRQSSIDNDTAAYTLYGVGGALFVSGLTWGLIAHYQNKPAPPKTTWLLTPFGDATRLGLLGRVTF